MGIVTIMSIAVTERTDEIGLLVALGARRRTILALFLGEAVVLAGIGGLLGLLAGAGLAQLVGLLVPAMPVATPWQFALAAEVRRGRGSRRWRAAAAAPRGSTR